MKTLISITRTLAIAVAMFSFASGAWAEHDGDGVADDADAVTDTEVVGDEDVLDSEVIGEEVIYYSMAGEGGEAAIDDSTEVVDNAEGGEVYPTEMYDSEGNVIYFRSNESGGEEVEMIPLMSQSGAAGGAVSLADTAADQAGIDSATDLSLDVIDSSQADFAGPIDVATVAADGSTRVGNGGTATRISGGHLDSQQ